MRFLKKMQAFTYLFSHMYLIDLPLLQPKSDLIDGALS